MKEKIVNYLKFAVFLWVMSIGFFSTYAILWTAIGIPTGLFASIIVFTLTGLSVWGFIKWIGRTDNA